MAGNHVAQIFNLLYRRFVIGRAPDTWRRAGSEHARQNGILRYGRLKICATTSASPHPQSPNMLMNSRNTPLTVAMLLLLSGIAPAADLSVKETLQRELQRSQPDYFVYVPGSFDGSTHDGHNEHFLVFDGPDGSLDGHLDAEHQRAERPGRQPHRLLALNG